MDIYLKTRRFTALAQVIKSIYWYELLKMHTDVGLTLNQKIKNTGYEMRGGGFSRTYWRNKRGSLSGNNY